MVELTANSVCSHYARLSKTKYFVLYEERSSHVKKSCRACDCIPYYIFSFGRIFLTHFVRIAILCFFMPVACTTVSECREYIFCCVHIARAMLWNVVVLCFFLVVVAALLLAIVVVICVIAFNDGFAKSQDRHCHGWKSMAVACTRTHLANTRRKQLTTLDGEWLAGWWFGMV